MKAVVFCMIGFILAGLGGSFVWKGFQANSWSHAEGQVIDYHETLSHDEWHHVPHMTYRFMAENVSYTSNQVGLEPLEVGNFFGHFNFGFPHSGFKQGQDVRVFYNPENPNESMLDKEITPGIWFIFGTGILCLLIGLMSMMPEGSSPDVEDL